MKSINRIEIKGAVGSTHPIKNGLSFSVATSISRKLDDGSYEQETTWHNVVAFNGYGVADVTRVGKGTKVYVVGRLRTREYDASDGSKRTAYEILADTLDIISEPSSQNQQNGGTANRQQAPAAAPAPANPSYEQAFGGPDDGVNF